MRQYKECARVLEEELGIPSITYEVDYIDARFAPHPSIKTKLTEFFQTLI